VDEAGMSRKSASMPRRTTKAWMAANDLDGSQAGTCVAQTRTCRCRCSCRWVARRVNVGGIASTQSVPPIAASTSTCSGNDGPRNLDAGGIERQDPEDTSKASQIEETTVDSP
jgi:hypothetical protein